MRILIAILVLLFCELQAGKIVYLISPPRSLSVGFLRMMEARGDFKVYHEPCLLPYFRLHNYAFGKDWFREGALESFEEVKQVIFQEPSNVFVKEMSFHLYEFLDDDLISHPNTYFVFLIRNPHSTIVSLYNKIGCIVEDFSDAIGHEKAWKIYEKIKAKNARPPLIIFSEALTNDPKNEIKNFCHYVEIPFIESALHWKNLGTEFNGHKEWHEGKVTELVQHWHGSAICSTQFEALRSYEIDENGNPTFSEIGVAKDREECQKFYQYHLPYYLLFKHEGSSIF